VCVCFSTVPSSGSNVQRPLLNHQVVVDQAPVIDPHPMLDHRPVVDVSSENAVNRNAVATNGVLEHVEVEPFEYLYHSSLRMRQKIYM